MLCDSGVTGSKIQIRCGLFHRKGDLLFSVGGISTVFN